MDNAVKYMSLCFCEDVAWAKITQATFIIHNGNSSRLRIDRCFLSHFYSIGSNFNPYTSSPYCTRIGSQLGFTFMPIFN